MHSHVRAASLPSLSMLPNDLYNNSSPHGTIPNVPGSISDRLVQKDNLASNQPIPGTDLNLNSIDREFYMLNNMDGAYKHAFVSSENLNESLTKYHAITPYQHSMVKSKLAKSTFINASRISGNFFTQITRSIVLSHFKFWLNAHTWAYEILLSFLNWMYLIYVKMVY